MYKILWIWMFPKRVVPPNHPFLSGVPLFSPSILGFPYFRKHPFMYKASEAESIQNETSKHPICCDTKIQGVVVR